ncbi:hypothetical protein [Marinifilum sp. D714]|uniref:hypothetical protein n=1 Tax=Marinifilum sp. D714 TaxID=2937523 RepID=UPI0027C99FAB|nr:hypothetical protein [Marinifilum sp. D714]MDQ2180404.1 hypothetical protein [Marinifilum sp. D714]
MKYFTFTILLLFMFSCSEPKELQQIDLAVNQKIIDKFSSYDSKLWDDLETEFYQRLENLNLMNSKSDSLQALKNLMTYVTTTGYPDEFYVDLKNPQNVTLINNLQKIGFKQDDESANEFLYDLISPILKEYKEFEQLSNSPRDMLIAFGTLNPDSIRISFDLSTLDFSKNYETNDLKRPGLYKSLLIFYFSRMISENR